MRSCPFCWAHLRRDGIAKSMRRSCSPAAAGSLISQFDPNGVSNRFLPKPAGRICPPNEGVRRSGRLVCLSACARFRLVVGRAKLWRNRSICLRRTQAGQIGLADSNILSPDAAPAVLQKFGIGVESVRCRSANPCIIRNNARKCSGGSYARDRPQHQWRRLSRFCGR